jgi:allantoate deiminase
MHATPLIPPLTTAAGILRRLDALALCTDTPGEITRLFLTPAHRQAITLVADWMREARLAPTLDPSGTLTGHLPAKNPQAPTLMLASHIDSVCNAGRYDGCLGVALAIALAAHFGPHTLPYHLDIRAFGDEEGVRFPVTLTGAHAAAGSFAPAWLDASDARGITLRQALAHFGLDPAALLAGACTAHASAYLEIHIEQGPVLDSHNAPVGIVTAINGAERHDITVAGAAGHAGTVPMAQRRDALAAAAEMVLAIEAVARRHANVVATVGRLDVTQGAANVIPGHVAFTLDLRAPDDALRHTAATAIFAALRHVAAARHVTVTHQLRHVAPAAACDPRLQASLAAAVEQLKLPVIHLPSGAGHDAMVMARHCPMGMLFVRCRGGVSHHPDEHVTEADVAAALHVMMEVLQEEGVLF